ncbi:MAG: hypothetical protein GF418_17190 [Chitinivibrionales bacterium]|nr:hypothetical protein [Chitinivibrionales bacterium]MBD3397355.1 hypothetical protein [Chitinivibrionales bacterium]
MRGGLMTLCIAALLASAATIPSVPSGHPRVFINPQELPGLKQRVQNSAFSETWQEVRGSSKPLCKAFVAMVQDDQTLAQEAAAAALTALKACNDARTPYNAMHVGACVYDWCYDALTSQQKQEYIAEFERVAGLHSPYYPARKEANAIVGHDCEAWLLTNQLPAGVAIYDESTTMYDSAVHLFFSKFVEPRNFHYQSHMHHQGDSYIGTRFQHDMYAAWLFRRMGAGAVFDSAQRYVPYQIIYHLRPDGQQMRSGDTYDDRGKSGQKRFCAMAAGTYYEDPYLLAVTDSDIFWSKSDQHCVFELLWRPTTASKPLAELSLTKYFPHPMGEMVARTGWTMGIESTAAVVHMRIGNYFFGNHQCKDFGIFQVYYRGPLAISSGIYEGTNNSYGSAHWTATWTCTLHSGTICPAPQTMSASGYRMARPRQPSPSRSWQPRDRTIPR